MANLKVQERRETRIVGRPRFKYSSALGGFSPQGVGVCVVEGLADEKEVTPPEKTGDLQFGRLFHFEGLVTDQLVSFINDDVLPRIQTDAVYTEAVKHDDHTIFLVHGEAAEQNPHEALAPFVNTFKGLLGLLEMDDHDRFWMLKYGKEPAPPSRPEPQDINPLENVMAVDSKTGPFQYIEHN